MLVFRISLLDLAAKILQDGVANLCPDCYRHFYRSRNQQWHWCVDRRLLGSTTPWLVCLLEPRCCGPVSRQLYGKKPRWSGVVLWLVAGAISATPPCDLIHAHTWSAVAVCQAGGR